VGSEKRIKCYMWTSIMERWMMEEGCLWKVGNCWLFRKMYRVVARTKERY